MSWAQVLPLHTNNQFTLTHDGGAACEGRCQTNVKSRMFKFSFFDCRVSSYVGWTKVYTI